MKSFTFIAVIFLCSKSLAQVPTELTWTRDYQGTSYSTINQFFDIEAQSCVFDTSGRLCVAGRTYDYNSSSGLWSEYLSLIKYFPGGSIYAGVNINGPNSITETQKVNKLVVDPNTNSIYSLSTYYYSNTHKTDIHLAKYNSKLLLIWEDFISGADSSIDAGVDMQLDTSGNVIIAGNIEDDGTGATTGQNIGVRKYSKTGGLIWKHFYTGANTDLVNAIKIDKKQDVIVTGSTFQPAKGDQLLVFKLSKNTGNLLWEYKYNGASATAGHDEGTDVDVDTNNQIYVSGTTELAGSVIKGLLIMLDSSGTPGFIKQLGYLPYPKSVIYKSNAVYIAGDDYSGGLQKIKLSKFKLNGTQSFALTYSATAASNTYFDDMLISNSSTIYMVGRADNSYYYVSINKFGNILWQHIDIPGSSLGSFGGTCLALDEYHGVSAGCGFRHFKNGAGVWVSNYYTPSVLRTISPDVLSSCDESFLNIYPNPTSNILTIDYTEQDYKIQITDLIGRPVLSEIFAPGNNTINIENLPSGAYIVTVTSGDKRDFKKFIKQ